MSKKSPLEGLHIVLGITGSIAAYKAAALTRLLVKAGAEVQVIMTPAAKEFITPVTLATLSGNGVISEFFTANTGEWHSHVSLGLWADAMVIAPATASTIAKMANGVADNMLVTSYLSARAPVFVAPAMDFDMMQHPTTVANIERLRGFGNIIIEPAEGELASHLVGKGRMEEPEKILEVLEDFFSGDKPLAGKKILITAGPTHEPVDAVRFLGNNSSGKMGYAIAEEAARRGAHVTLVSGPVALKAQPTDIDVVPVTTALQMKQACEEAFVNADVAIMSAAVADYRPATCCDSKIKREEGTLTSIQLVENPDIAAGLGKVKRNDQVLIGFALETDDLLKNGEKKLKAKNLDFIVLNNASEPGAGFNTDTNHIAILDSTGHLQQFPLKPKTGVACDILDRLQTILANR